jgi:sulfoxide reductase heme-binding subunit YedZ
VSAMAGVIHYYWLVKADHRLPLTYAAILAVLLAYRVGKWARPKLVAGRVAAAARNA